MIKAILKTMFGLVVVFVAFISLMYPPLFLGLLVLYVAYWVGKSMLG